MKIDENILKKTTRCENDFECLKDENYPCRVLKVESCINGEIIIVNCTKSKCLYKVIFGRKTICACPTRIEIYNKYKK